MAEGLPKVTSQRVSNTVRTDPHTGSVYEPLKTGSSTVNHSKGEKPCLEHCYGSSQLYWP